MQLNKILVALISKKQKGWKPLIGLPIPELNLKPHYDLKIMVKIIIQLFNLQTHLAEENPQYL